MPAEFVIYQSVKDVENFRKYTSRVADHFDSEVMAEKYLDGLIDWNGNELCDIHGAGGCHCLDLDWM